MINLCVHVYSTVHMLYISNGYIGVMPNKYIVTHFCHILAIFPHSKEPDGLKRLPSLLPPKIVSKSITISMIIILDSMKRSFKHKCINEVHDLINLI